MIYKDYFFKDIEGASLDKLRSGTLSEEEYSFMHSKLPISCHDVFVNYKGRIIFGKRKDDPAKGKLWPMGGRMERGLSTLESLSKKTKKECGLNIKNIQFLGAARTVFFKDPFKHGYGTDTPTVVFFADGEGKLKLDTSHEKFTLLDKKEYLNLKKDFNPFVRDFMNLIISKNLI